MDTSYIVVALIAGLAGGLISALVIVFAQLWMARPRRSWAPYYSAPPGAAPARERFTRIEGGRGPFDRFNDRAKRVLALAQDEAVRFNHNYIGTEHLLLGLVREGEGVAAHVLNSLGVELSKVRKAVEFIIGRGDATTSPSEITLSPRTKKVIEFAADEARKLGHSHVGTEHILLGLVREGEGVAAAVLTNLNVDVEEVEQTIEQRVTKGGAARVAGPDLPYTRGAKKVLELAMAETRELDHSYVGSEHLLLGLLREGAGVAAEVLTDLGVTLEEARAETLRLLGTEMPSGPPRPRRAEILDRMRVLVNELLGVPAPDASRLGELATELSGLLDDLGRPQ